MIGQDEVLSMTSVYSPRTSTYGRSTLAEPLAWVFFTAMTTSNPTVEALNAFERYLPQRTTVLAARRTASAFAAHISDAVPAGDRIRDILRYLGLTKTQLKDACQVSRQTLYDWLDGRFEPGSAHAARLRDIHALAREVASLGTPLSARAVQSPLPDGRTLAQMLTDDAPQFEEMRGLVAALAGAASGHRSRSAKALLEKLGGASPAEHAQRATLDDNLEKIG